MLPIENITRENFAPFGTLLAFDEPPEDARFAVKATEENAGWRMAVFRVTIREAAGLECHPDTLEAFIPSGGMGVLLCAALESPEKLHAFLLDAPVCLHKGTWHEVIALSTQACYQIAENLQVTSRFHSFAMPVSAGVR